MLLFNWPEAFSIHLRAVVFGQLQSFLSYSAAVAKVADASADSAGTGRRGTFRGLVLTGGAGATKAQHIGGDRGRSLNMTVEHSCVPFATACVTLALVLGSWLGGGLERALGRAVLERCAAWLCRCLGATANHFRDGVGLHATVHSWLGGNRGRWVGAAVSRKGPMPKLLVWFHRESCFVEVCLCGSATANAVCVRICVSANTVYVRFAR